MRLVFLLLLFCFQTLLSQKTLPKDYFQHPLNIPLVVSGTFGELRSNHFHSGLDLKTGGQEGLPVFAAAQGQVTRIKVSHGGYGKALYISHPNGYTSVYAHLQKFAPEIEAYVKKRQYAKESYEIELYPKTGAITLEKGEIIAYSGNTGGSGGPHLHFEIRDGKARPMNPLLFGLQVEDHKKPIINGLWAYPSENKAHLNGSQLKQKIRLSPTTNGNYTSSTLEAYGEIGFGVSTVDLQDLASNKNGIYKVVTKLNGKTKLEFTMDKFSFSETRYINRLIDFAHYKTKRNRITKLFLEPNNLLSIYDQKDKDGLLFIEDGLSYNYEIEIFDQHDNKTKITIPLKGKKMDSIILPSNPKTDYLALPEEPFVYNSGIFDVYIPKGSLYGPVYLNINTTGDVLQLHKDEVALHKYMTVAADISNYEEKDKPYLYIGELNYRDEPYYSRTNRKGDRLTTRTRSFGRYGIFSDRTPPSIVPINVSEKKWMSKETHLKFKINDAQTGIESYRGTINGKFILMEYDYKTGMLIYDFSDEVITDTENKLKLLVLDKVGNKKVYETLFYRKNIN